MDNKWATSGQQVDNKWTTVRGNCSLYPSGLPYLNGSKYICRFTFTFTLTGAKTAREREALQYAAIPLHILKIIPRQAKHRHEWLSWCDESTGLTVDVSFHQAFLCLSKDRILLYFAFGVEPMTLD